jgi:hypothetical protein
MVEFEFEPNHKVERNSTLGCKEISNSKNNLCSSFTLYAIMFPEREGQK